MLFRSQCTGVNGIPLFRLRGEDRGYVQEFRKGDDQKIRCASHKNQLPQAHRSPERQEARGDAAASGATAVKWSGPETTCNDPAKNPVSATKLIGYAPLKNQSSRARRPTLREGTGSVKERLS